MKNWRKKNKAAPVLVYRWSENTECNNTYSCSENKCTEYFIKRYFFILVRWRSTDNNANAFASINLNNCFFAIGWVSHCELEPKLTITLGALFTKKKNLNASMPWKKLSNKRSRTEWRNYQIQMKLGSLGIFSLLIDHKICHFKSIIMINLVDILLNIFGFSFCWIENYGYQWFANYSSQSLLIRGLFIIRQIEHFRKMVLLQYDFGIHYTCEHMSASMMTMRMPNRKVSHRIRDLVEYVPIFFVSFKREESYGTRFPISNNNSGMWSAQVKLL